MPVKLPVGYSSPENLIDAIEILQGAWDLGSVGWRDFGTFLDITLGQGRYRYGEPTGAPSSSIPPLDAVETLEISSTLPPAIDRRDLPPLQTDLPESMSPLESWLAGNNPGLVVTLNTTWLAGGGYQTWWVSGDERLLKSTYDPANSLSSGIIETEEEDVSLISDIYDYVDETYFDGNLPLGTPPTTGGPDYFVGPSTAPVPTTGPGPVGPTVAGTPPVVNCGGGSPVYKKVCGSYRWVQPKRRRRKSLATKGDLRDLASLKGILGTGKAFEVWIATHA